MPRRVIARIFVRYGRYHSFRQIVSNGLVGHRVPIIPAVAPRSLPELRVRLLGLAYTGEHRRGYKRRIIETVLSCQPKLSSQGQRGQLCIGAHYPVVRKNPQNPLRLLSFGHTSERTCIKGCAHTIRSRLFFRIGVQLRRERGTVWGRPYWRNDAWRPVFK